MAAGELIPVTVTPHRTAPSHIRLHRTLPNFTSSTKSASKQASKQTSTHARKRKKTPASNNVHQLCCARSDAQSSRMHDLLFCADDAGSSPVNCFFLSFFLSPSFLPLTRPLRQKFKASGCPNCEPVLQNFGPEAIEDTTSPVFEGLIALREPTKSWVGRWQRVDGFVRGVYAVKVSGNVRFSRLLCSVVRLPGSLYVLGRSVCRVALCAESLCVLGRFVCWVALCAGSLAVPGRSVCRIANCVDRSAARGDLEGAGEQRHRLPATRRQLCDGRLKPSLKCDGVCMGCVVRYTESKAGK